MLMVVQRLTIVGVLLSIVTGLVAMLWLMTSAHPRPSAPVVHQTPVVRVVNV